MNTKVRSWSVQCYPTQMTMTTNQSSSLLYLILGLQCLKNWRNLGIIMLRGLFRASLSRSSDESSQIFCSAPNEPWDTDIHREAVKSNANIQENRGESETASANNSEAKKKSVLGAINTYRFSAIFLELNTFLVRSPFYFTIRRNANIIMCAFRTLKYEPTILTKQQNTLVLINSLDKSGSENMGTICIIVNQWAGFFIMSGCKAEARKIVNTPS